MILYCLKPKISMLEISVKMGLQGLRRSNNPNMHANGSPMMPTIICDVNVMFS